MKRRKGIIAVIVASVGLGVAALPAAAELHSVTVVLVSGQRITKTVDVPPGTPVSLDPDPRHHGRDRADHRQRRDRHADAERRADRPGPDRPRRADRARPEAEAALDADPGRQREARRAEPHPGRLGGPATRNAQPGNRKFKAGNTNSKKLISQLERQAKKKARAKVPGRAVDGTPTLDNPTFSLAQPGAAPIGVPNFFIDKFRIPPFLLPIYQAAGIEYGVRWEVLAAINEIETDYGRNLNVSTAGAVGWMQFMPATWKQYGVDANKDGFKDPYNPRRRDLRHRPLPQGRRRRAGPAQGDLRLQPRRLVRRLGPHARAPDRRPALQLRRLAHRADPGPLPGRRQGHLRRRLHRDGREEGQQEVAPPG